MNKKETSPVGEPQLTVKVNPLELVKLYQLFLAYFMYVEDCFSNGGYSEENFMSDLNWFFDVGNSLKNMAAQVLVDYVYEDPTEEEDVDNPYFMLNAFNNRVVIILKEIEETLENT